ncbi:hypothetical protein Tco_0503118 [Tanacetum coccineum]
MSFAELLLSSSSAEPFDERPNIICLPLKLVSSGTFIRLAMYLPDCSLVPEINRGMVSDVSGPLIAESFQASSLLDDVLVAMHQDSLGFFELGHHLSEELKASSIYHRLIIIIYHAFLLWSLTLSATPFHGIFICLSKLPYEQCIEGRDVVIVVASVLIGGGVTSNDGLEDETSVKGAITG